MFQKPCRSHRNQLDPLEGIETRERNSIPRHNPKNIETAKNIAIYTLLGLLILLLARGIIAVVYGIVGEEALDIGIIIGRIFAYMFWLLLMSSALSFLLSAYYFLMGGENEEYRKMGKSVLIFTIVAIVLAILSRGIAEFVVRIVSG